MSSAAMKDAQYHLYEGTLGMFFVGLAAWMFVGEAVVLSEVVGRAVRGSFDLVSVFKLGSILPSFLLVWLVFRGDFK